MQVNSKKTYDFFRDETHQAGSEILHLSPTGTNFVLVPDWLKENSHFRAAVADGSIIVGEILSRVTAPAPASEPERIGFGESVMLNAMTGEPEKTTEPSPLKPDPKAPRVRIQKGPSKSMTEASDKVLVEQAKRKADTVAQSQPDSARDALIEEAKRGVQA